MKRVLNNPIFVTILVLVSLVMVYLNIRSIWESDSEFSSEGSDEIHYVEEVESDADDTGDESNRIATGEKNSLNEYQWEINSERNPFLLGRVTAPIMLVEKSPSLKKRVVLPKKKSLIRKKVEKIVVPTVVDSRIQAIIHGGQGPLVYADDTKLALGDSYRDGEIKSILHDHFIVEKSGKRIKYVIDSLGGNR